jgi:hypothetical protein
LAEAVEKAAVPSIILNHGASITLSTLNIAPVKEGRARKLTIDDGVFERLEIEAKRRKTTMSALVNDLLDRNLPVFEVTVNVIKRNKTEERSDAVVAE